MKIRRRLLHPAVGAIALPTAAGVARAQSYPTRRSSVVVFVLLAIATGGLALIPLFFNEIPPLVDYPNHLARGVVLHGGDSLDISRFYVANWTVIPNVGCDILLMGLLHLFQPALAGCVLLGMVIVVQILGIVLYASLSVAGPGGHLELCWQLIMASSSSASSILPFHVAWRFLEPLSG
jgi:hypothetical protein